MAAPAEASTLRTAWVRTLAEPVRAFLRTEVSSAIFLLAAALAALVWVNSPWGSSYDSLWSTELTIRIGDSSFGGDLRYWVNDGLMAIFFLVIGLELRRELDVGELRARRRAAVPVLAGVGGMALPVVIYLTFTRGTEGVEGWGMVMPTDTAFALGVLALLGRRVPQRLRVWTLTVVIADDIGVLIVIALVYMGDLSLSALGIAFLLFLTLLALLRMGVLSRPPLILLSIAIWVATAESGVHATIAGVAMGLAISGRPPAREDVEQATAATRRFREQPTARLARLARQSFLGAVSRNERLQYGLHPWAGFLIVPLFALANAGVRVDRELLGRALDSRITLGILFALVVGKFLGIGLTTLVATHLRLGRLPLTVELPSVFGTAAVAGIGFTLSLYIAEIAFTGELLEEAKVGVLAASITAALLGYLVFQALEHIPRRVLRQNGRRPAEPIVDLAVEVDPSQDHVRGAEDAPVTLVEYGDYECPYCGRAEPVVHELLEDFGDDVRFVWRHLPLNDVHPNAQLAAEAAEAAGEQGAFWSMHDRLLAAQDELDAEGLRRHAEELGLDLDRFWESVRNREHAPRVADHVDSADMSGVTGTPSFFVDGRRHDGAYDHETLSRVIREELARKSSKGVEQGRPG